MKNDGLEIKGNIILELFDKDGNLKQEVQIENTVLNVGREMIIDRLQGNSPDPCSWIAIGYDNTAAAAAQTGLISEVIRGSGALSQPNANTDRCVYTFEAGSGTGLIVEAGRINASTGGVMMGRQTFSSIDKQSSDSLQVTYDFTYAAG